MRIALKMEMVYSPMGVYPTKIVPSPFQEKLSRCSPNAPVFFIIPKIPAGRRRAPRRDKPASLSRSFQRQPSLSARQLLFPAYNPRGISRSRAVLAANCGVATHSMRASWVEERFT